MVDTARLELSGHYGVDYLVRQHQVFDVLPGNNDPLVTGELLSTAIFEEPFNLLVDAADGWMFPCDRRIL